MKILASCMAALAICCISDAWCQQKTESPPVMQFKNEVACVADANGTKHPVLRKSSGYRELDQAALKAAKAWCPAPARTKIPTATEQKPSAAT